MLDVNQAYSLAKAMTKDLEVAKILNFGEEFGFLFVKDKSKTTFGTSYILVNRKTKVVSQLPAVPANVEKIQSAKNIPLTALSSLQLRSAKS